MGERVARSLATVLVAVTAATATGATAGCGGATHGAPEGATVAASTVPGLKVMEAGAHRWDYARARFRETCGGCHTLADAGTTGRRFNLDASATLTEEHTRFAILEGEPGMPRWKGVLSRREVEELTAYVVAVARHERGENFWSWQIHLRGEGEEWKPGELP